MRSIYTDATACKTVLEKCHGDLDENENEHPKTY